MEDYEIRVEGERLRVWLNGAKINDFTNTDPVRSLRDGHIGLQNHGADDQASFRDVRIKELPTKGDDRRRARGCGPPPAVSPTSLLSPLSLSPVWLTQRQGGCRCPPCPRPFPNLGWGAADRSPRLRRHHRHRGLRGPHRRPAPPDGMVTETSLFAECGLPTPSSLVFGGHDTVDCPLPKRAEALAAGGVLPPGLPSAIAAELAAADAEIRPGGPAPGDTRDESELVDAFATDLRDFVRRRGLTRRSC